MLSSSLIAVPLTPVFRTGLVSVLFVNVCVPVNVATVESIEISFALAVIPVPPTTFNVTAPAVPPPVKPSPAPTAVMSAAFVLAIEIVVPELLIAIPAPAANVIKSPLSTTTFPVVGVTNFQAL